MTDLSAMAGRAVPLGEPQEIQPPPPLLSAQGDNIAAGRLGQIIIVELRNSILTMACPMNPDQTAEIVTALQRCLADAESERDEAAREATGG